MKFPRFSFRDPAPKAAFAFRWLYPVVLVGLIGSAYLVAQQGKDSALKITKGNFQSVPTDPSAPGYFANVDPTPTQLLLVVNANHDLVGISALSQQPDGKGGSLMQVPVEAQPKDGKPLWVLWNDVVHPSSAPATTVKGASTTSTTVAPKGDPAAAAQVIAGYVSRMANVSFGADPAVVTTQQLAANAKTSFPFSVNLDAPVTVIGADGALKTLFRAGSVAVDEEREFIELFEASLSTASPSLRWNRQMGLLRGWIDSARTKKVPVAPALDKRVAPFFGAFDNGDVQINKLPTKDEQSAFGLWILPPDEARLHQLALEMVPLPVAIEPGQRLRVSMYNGTPDTRLLFEAPARLVAAGAQIDRLGNAEVLNFVKSEVVYYDETKKSQVEKFARSLGVDNVRFREEKDAPFEATVTLGSDFRV